MFGGHHDYLSAGYFIWSSSCNLAVWCASFA